MKTIVNRLPLTKARVNLGQVVRRVHVNREFFILEKDGIPVVGLMHVDDLEDYLEMQNRSVKRANPDESPRNIVAEQRAVRMHSWLNLKTIEQQAQEEVNDKLERHGRTVSQIRSPRPRSSGNSERSAGATHVLSPRPRRTD